MARAAAHAAPEPVAWERPPPVLPLWAVMLAFWAAVLAGRARACRGCHPRNEALADVRRDLHFDRVEALPFVLLGALCRRPSRCSSPSAASRGSPGCRCRCRSPARARGLAMPGVRVRLGAGRAAVDRPRRAPRRRASRSCSQRRSSTRSCCCRRRSPTGPAARWRWCSARAALGLVVASSPGWLIGRRRVGRLLDDARARRPRPRPRHAAARAAFVDHLAADFLFMGSSS